LIDSIAERFGGTKRSSMWHIVRNDFIEKNNKCICCGSKKKLQVHHIIPFCVKPELELDENNLATMCSRCHLLIGHAGWWMTHNKDFNETVDTIRKMIRDRSGCNYGNSLPPSGFVQFIQNILRSWYHF